MTNRAGELPLSCGRDGLGERTFSGALQHRFANLSGDFNPLHVDANAARRTVLGVPVVHGVHLVLAGLDLLMAQATGGLSRVKATFSRPVRVGESIRYAHRFIGEERSRLEYYSGTTRLGRIDVWHDLAKPFVDVAAIADSTFSPVAPRDPDWDTAVDFSTTVKLSCDRKLLAELFPNLAAAGEYWVAAVLLSSTRVVGMLCPGLNSLYAKFDFKFVTGGSPDIRYATSFAKREYSTLTLQAVAGGASGEVECFRRPSPVSQKTFAEVAELVRGFRAEDSRVLVVGGSRGLGEVTAKLVCALGGRALITYARGRAEAERVAQEIGDRCTVTQLDVLSDDQADFVAAVRDFAPTTLFYYASGPIFSPRASADLNESFQSFYVTGFERVVRTVLATTDLPLRAYWPSSVALDEETPGMEEYIRAKLDGEHLVRRLNAEIGRLEIFSTRLPRIATDQTASLLGIPAVSAEDVITKVVLTMLGAREPVSAGVAVGGG